MTSLLLSILSGLLLTVSFPDTDWHILAWVGLVPFFFAIEGKDSKETFRIGYLGGIAFYWSLFYWLNSVTVAGFLILTLYLALYFPLFGLVMNYLRGRSRVPAWIAAPLAWTALEYLRTYAFSGLPWGVIGVTQHRAAGLVQIASVTGVYGVSSVVVMVNAAAYECLRRRGRGSAAPIGVALCLLIACLAYGAWWMKRDLISGERVRVAMVQGNVPQEEKFGLGFTQEIIRRFHDLTIEASREKPDLIVWPETSVPGYFWYDPVIRGAVAALESEVRTPLLFGSEHMIEDGRRQFFNCAFLVDERGEPVDRYDKIHLVLFGEIVPCKGIFPFLMKMVPYEMDFTPGSRFTIFPLAKGDFGAIICFEDIMPDLTRGFVRRGARFMVNITNDAWFGRTSQPYLHVAHAVFRCVENCVPMVRATNTGVSCYIDHHGRVTRMLTDRSGEELFVQGTAAADIQLTRVRTFYTRYGNLWAIACSVATILMCGMALRGGRRRAFR